jgi:hypothetical protein
MKPDRIIITCTPACWLGHGWLVFFFVISGGAMELIIIIACFLRRGGPQIAVHVWLLLS